MVREIIDTVERQTQKRSATGGLQYARGGEDRQVDHCNGDQQIDEGGRDPANLHRCALNAGHDLAARRGDGREPDRIE